MVVETHSLSLVLVNKDVLRPSSREGTTEGTLGIFLYMSKEKPQVYLIPTITVFTKDSNPECKGQETDSSRPKRTSKKTDTDNHQDPTSEDLSGRTYIPSVIPLGPLNGVTARSSGFKGFFRWKKKGGKSQQDTKEQHTNVKQNQNSPPWVFLTPMR